jgi:hypothetical protein
MFFFQVDEAEDKHPDIRPEGHDAVGADGLRRRREKELAEYDDRELYDNDGDQDHEMGDIDI